MQSAKERKRNEPLQTFRHGIKGRIVAEKVWGDQSLRDGLDNRKLFKLTANHSGSFFNPRQLLSNAKEPSPGVLPL